MGCRAHSPVVPDCFWTSVLLQLFVLFSCQQPAFVQSASLLVASVGKLLDNSIVGVAEPMREWRQETEAGKSKKMSQGRGRTTMHFLGALVPSA